VIGKDEKPDMYTHWEERNQLRAKLRKKADL